MKSFASLTQENVFIFFFHIRIGMRTDEGFHLRCDESGSGEWIVYVAEIGRWQRINVLWLDLVLCDLLLWHVQYVCLFLWKFHNNIWKFVKCALRGRVHAVFNNHSIRHRCHSKYQRNRSVYITTILWNLIYPFWILISVFSVSPLFGRLPLLGLHGKIVRILVSIADLYRQTDESQVPQSSQKENINLT